jgi:hypothetical protein
VRQIDAIWNKREQELGTFQRPEAAQLNAAMAEKKASFCLLVSHRKRRWQIQIAQFTSEVTLAQRSNRFTEV